MFSILCIEIAVIDLTVLWACLRNRKNFHAIAKNIHYGVIRCLIEFYHENDNYFTRFTILAIQGEKAELFAPKTNIRHSTEAECRMFVCYPILFDSCRNVVIFYGLLSYEHTADGGIFYGLVPLG